MKCKHQRVALMIGSAPNRVLVPSDFNCQQLRKCAGDCERLYVY